MQCMFKLICSLFKVTIFGCDNDLLAVMKHQGYIESSFKSHSWEALCRNSTVVSAANQAQK